MSCVKFVSFFSHFNFFIFFRGILKQRKTTFPNILFAQCHMSFERKCFALSDCSFIDSNFDNVKVIKKREKKLFKEQELLLKIHLNVLIVHFNFLKIK